MKLTIKGNKFIIEGELDKGKPSASGKTIVVASTRGNQRTEAEIDGKPVTIGVNMFYPIA